MWGVGAGRGRVSPVVNTPSTRHEKKAGKKQMSQFKIGDEVVVRGTVVGWSLLGHPVVNIDGKRVQTDGLTELEPAPVEYDFAFDVQVTSVRSVRATTETGARSQIDEMVDALTSSPNFREHEDVVRVSLVSVSLDGNDVDEWAK